MMRLVEGYISPRMHLSSSIHSKMTSFSLLVILLWASPAAVHGFVSPASGMRTPLVSPSRHFPFRSGTSRSSWSLDAIAIGKPSEKRDRFDRTAPSIAHVDEPCILTIDGIQYNVTSYAKAHPGGVKVLQTFHGKDATRAFQAADHSKEAIALLGQFAISSSKMANSTVVDTTGKQTIQMLETTFPSDSKCPVSLVSMERKRPRWIQKLFTKEDPIGIHKFLGVFVLLHFAFRFMQMLFGDPSAGFGTRLGKGPGIIAPLCLVPHGLLSLSSLIFHTVPRERVVGKPMIWQEYRIHNICFGLRSVITGLFAWLTIYMGNTPAWRRIAVTACCTTALVANVVADEGTRRLRVDTKESTTATMPYWEGCSIETQKRFKSFYAYSQFLATGACITVGNPAWSLAVLLAIQMASLLMTLVRKGLLSAKGYHIGYTITLVLPYFVAMRDMTISKSLDFPVMAGIGWVLYQLRRHGVNKYALWLPVYAFRIAYGDRFINWQVW